MFGLFRPNEAKRIAQFWHWFEANQQKIFDIECPNDEQLGLLFHQLDKVDRNLTLELSLKKEAPKELILSAGGIKETFPLVEKLVDAAPLLQNWQFIAFKPRRNLEELAYPGADRLPLNALWYQLDTSQSPFGLNLYIVGHQPESLSVHAQICFFILDNLIGEFQVAHHLGEIDFIGLPEEDSQRALIIQQEGLRPITGFAQHFDEALAQSDGLPSQQSLV
jgi:hypothetical protein